MKEKAKKKDWVKIGKSIWGGLGKMGAGIMEAEGLVKTEKRRKKKKR